MNLKSWLLHIAKECIKSQHLYKSAVKLVRTRGLGVLCPEPFDLLIGLVQNHLDNNRQHRKQL